MTTVSPYGSLLALLLALATACSTEAPPVGGSAAAATGPSLSDHDRRAIERVSVIELADRFSDACNIVNPEAFAALWHPEGAVWRIGPPINREFRGRDSLGAAVSQMVGQWDFFVQAPGASVVEFSDDYTAATGRTYLIERARPTGGDGGNYNMSYYLDTLSKVDGEWLYASRTYHTIYQEEDHVFDGKLIE